MHLLTVTAVVLKIATLAPEGTSWMKLFHEFQTRVESRTQARVKIKFYAGGTQGDEKDMIRKMRLGQLSGAAITGIGLSMIAPEVRALEAARSYEELDHARERLDPLLRKKFDEKGFLLMGWGDVGPVHVFSQRPIKSLDDLRMTKLWMFADDPVTKQMFSAMGLHGVPMGVPEVLPSLSTGNIDAFFGSPLSVVVLQWASHAKYMTSAVVGMATGATVLSKTAWAQVTPDDQKIIVEEGKTMEAAVKKLIRDDNDKAMKSLESKYAIQVVPTPIEMQRDVTRRAMAIANQNTGLWSKDFQVEVNKLLEEYRKNHPNEM